MERLCTDYSNKSIPIPSQNKYKLQLISKVEHLLKRMRWKTLQFQGKLERDNKEKYGFKSRKCPNGIDELSKFEDDLMLMIQNIEFRNVSNTFQDQLKNGISEIRTQITLQQSLNGYRKLYPNAFLIFRQIKKFMIKILIITKKL